mgnify:CR=1 FL=1
MNGVELNIGRVKRSPGPSTKLMSQKKSSATLSHIQ